MANNVTLDGNPIEIDGKFPQPGDNAAPVSYTHLTLPTNREV